MNRCVGLFAAILSACFTPAIFAYSGGEGTSDNPYQIATPADWQQLMNTSAHWSKHFLLTADLDLAGANLTPVGTKSWAFNGNFNGNGHIIRNAIIDIPDSDYVGLFGYVDSRGEIKYMGLENFTIVGHKFVGGIAGRNDGTVDYCYTTSTVSGQSFVGGLIGYNFGDLTACYCKGNVTSNVHTGGLIGSNPFGSVTACYAAGNVSGESSGGLLGTNSKCVIASFWDMSTTGQSSSAGGKGLTSSQMKTVAIFRDAGWGAYGWVMADNEDYPRLCWEGAGYSAIPSMEPVPLDGSGTAEDPYQIWTPADFSLLSWHSSILDKHILLMDDIDVSIERLLPIGDLGPFIGFFDGNSHKIQNVIIDLPKNNFVGLFGCVGRCGQINNLCIENAHVTGCHNVGSLIGLNDSGITTSCCSSGFIKGAGDNVGGLIGKNISGKVQDCHAIGVVNGGSSVGGLVGNNDYGVVSNCYSTVDVSKIGTYCFSIGGLIGENRGNVISCYATGDVSGDYNIGGLIGWSWGNVTLSYATGFVSGNALYVGGLMGYNDHGSVTLCYATGNVKGEYAGGLVGMITNGGCVNYCYATGDINNCTIDHETFYIGGLVGINNNGKVIQCYSIGKPKGTYGVGGLCGYIYMGNSYEDKDNFWNMDTSETEYSAMGKKKYSTEMQMQSTFTGAGWDFTNESMNGTEEVWRMCVDGADYAKLNWQAGTGDFLCPDRIGNEDLELLRNSWLGKPGSGNWDGRCDLNGDGKINNIDLLRFRKAWEQQQP